MESDRTLVVRTAIPRTTRGKHMNPRPRPSRATTLFALALLASVLPARHGWAQG